MKTEITPLKVSATTAKFVTALDLLEKTQEQFLAALVELCGEEQGEKQYLDVVSNFDDVKLHISTFLTASIVEKLNDSDLEGII